MKTLRCYHFTGETLRNGQPIPRKGMWIKHPGDVIPCKSGLHGSEHPFNALQYAPGNYLHLVDLRGDLVSNGDPIDKWVGRERKIVTSIDAEPLLWIFARTSALSVAHLWDAPDVVLEYLVTGEETLRDAARDAARATARDAARNAARDAARATVRDAAWATARATAWDAARATVRATVRATAWDAAWDAAQDERRSEFKTLVDAAFEEEMEN